jgi:hypothetical protein
MKEILLFNKETQWFETHEIVENEDMLDKYAISFASTHDENLSF